MELKRQGRHALPEEIQSLVRVARLVESLPDPLIDPMFAATLEDEIAVKPAYSRELALSLALDGATAPRDPEIAALVALARVLETLPDPEINSVFADRLERMLLTVDATAPISAAVAMAAVPPELATVVELARRRPVLRRALVAAIAAALLVALPVAASANALPGSPLYGLRLRMEHIHLSWTCQDSDVACGFGHLELARHRLTDLEQIVATGDTRYVPPTARTLRRELSEGTTKILGARPSTPVLHRLTRALDRTTVALSDLLDRAPMPVRQALADAIGTGRELSGRVFEALGGLPASLDGRPVPPPRTRIAEPPANNGKGRRTSAEQQKKSGNNFGPGGVPPIKKPAPGEEWRADDPMRSECATAAVGGTPSSVDDPVCAVLDKDGGR